MAKTIAPADITIGWVCALPIELAAAAEMMDEEYADLPQPPNDTNIYTYGRIGVHNVVAACLPAGLMGTNQAATVASQIKSSFPALRFGLMVGIGGGVSTDENDVRLGDVVISQPAGEHGGVVQFDSGKTGPDGSIIRTGSLNAPPMILLNALAKLRANDIRGKTRVSEHLSKFSGLQKFAYPGSQRDTLYVTSSKHIGSTCGNCNPNDVVERESRITDEPVLFFGTIASGNQELRDGPTRDRISHDLGGVLCFEMEAAGLMNSFPCLVIRGICDYADAHKNKQWQPYAAATAAACTKELLYTIPPVQSAVSFQQESLKKESHFIVPLGRNDDFVGRDKILRQLYDRVPPNANEDNCQRTVIEGLGGVGKTQIALQVAYHIRQAHPDCSVFWIPAINMVTFENAYRDIGHALKIPHIEDDEADIKSLVKAALLKSPGSWLLIIDNIDNVDLLFGNSDSPSLRDYLPFSHKGSILFTTRNHEVSNRLDVQSRGIFVITEMSEIEAIEMLRTSLRDDQMRDEESTKGLLEFLTCLPLAIKQASAYMARTGISTAQYLGYCHDSDKSQIKLLSENFEDLGRYREISNPIATTWLISFQHITQNYPLAAQFLKCICLLAEKDIPISLLPGGEGKMERDEALGTLKGYAFIIIRENHDSFDCHRLVRLVMRNWLKEEITLYVAMMIRHLSQVYPYPETGNRQEWIRYIPHTQFALQLHNESVDQEAYANLLSYFGRTQAILGKYDLAEKLYRQTLELRRDILGPEHTSTLKSMNDLGLALERMGKYDEADKMHRETLELKEKLFGHAHPSTLTSINNWATVLYMKGKYDEAENLHQDALNLKKKLLGSEDPSTFSSMNNLAYILERKGKHDEAENMHRQTLKLRVKVLGQEHPDTLLSMSNVSRVLSTKGNYDEAEKMGRETLELRKKILGAEHPDTLVSMNNLANVLYRKRKYSEAEEMHRQVLQLVEKVLGPEHPSTLTSRKNWTAVLRHKMKYEEIQGTQTSSSAD